MSSAMPRTAPSVADSSPAPQRLTRLPLGRSKHRFSFERRLRIWLTVLGLPAVVLAFLATSLATSGLFWPTASALGCAALWAILCSFFFEQITRPLQTLSNVVSALREDDFSFRARGGQRGDSLGDLALEINALASGMQQQRSAASEAITLVERVLTTMQSPVLAFDNREQLRLLNAAAERAFSLSRASSIGCHARELHLSTLFEMPDGGIYEPLDSTLHASRWTVARTPFRIGGVPHTLLVLSDVTAVLREEERTAWQRLIRVLSHEINNSLTPIQSIAASLRGRLGQQPATPAMAADLLRGLLIIEERSAALNRFLQAYQRLLRLPPPAFRTTRLSELVAQVAQLERRVEVQIDPGPDLSLPCDPDQIQQALINLVQNAADAVLSPDLHHPGFTPRVHLGWSATSAAVLLSVEDNGAGIANFANLFVPFYTTKPNGSGIGLALAQQIAQAHGGSISVAPNHHAPGTRVEMQLPRRAGGL